MSKNGFMCERGAYVFNIHSAIFIFFFIVFHCTFDAIRKTRPNQNNVEKWCDDVCASRHSLTIQIPCALEHTRQRKHVRINSGNACNARWQMFSGDDYHIVISPTQSQPKTLTHTKNELSCHDFFFYWSEVSVRDKRKNKWMTTTTNKM